ncbi:MAG: nickel-dependent lactate racemase [Candidatus Eisenbacteria bacterium]|nr:nickel-dependent lactate racemase [Candidatus Eisenbacteria bacterium]
MKTQLLYASGAVEVTVPDGATVYSSSYPRPPAPPNDIVMEAIRNPIGSQALGTMLKKRRPGDVVIVVSDITRPIPYARFLKAMIEEIVSAGVPREEILILIGTGTHRPSSAAERRGMFGEEICSSYRILDHKADDDSELVELEGKSWSGSRIKLNRHLVRAGFRIITGLVEPHFMAGFSGGRKAICPGLVSMEMLRSFHGYEFLANPLAQNGQLDDNPCHLEALSVARSTGVDFTLNIVLNQKRQIVRTFAGELDASHRAACDSVRTYACPKVEFEHDVVLTSCGGYPLDTTFYQCVKGMVSCLPAVKDGGAVISLGSCSEGVGSPDYRAMMFEYSGRWREFLNHIRANPEVRKDQWELQMQARALEKVGDGNLYFATEGLATDEVNKLSMRAVRVRDCGVRTAVQELLDRLVGKETSLAVIPEGPYCTPIGG